MAAKQQGDQFFDFDISKYLGEFKVPGVDVETIVSSQKKNIEALTQANRLAYDGLQAVVKRQVEILRQTMDQVSTATKDITEPGSAQEMATHQIDMAKDAFEKALGNMRELAEMVAKANSEAFELLNKRFSQGMEEMRDACTKATKK